MNRSLDSVVGVADAALRTLFAKPHATRPTPSPDTPSSSLNDAERREAGALMRVNHVGEVCAQALYTAQAAVTRDAALRMHFSDAAREEIRVRVQRCGASTT